MHIIHIPALRSLNCRLAYSQHILEVDSAAYNIYVSIAVQKKYLSVIYDYGMLNYLDQKTAMSELVFPTGEVFVTCIEGPYPAGMDRIIIESVAPVEEIVNGKKKTFFPNFMVSIFSVCKFSTCTGSTAADIAVTNGVVGHLEIDSVPTYISSAYDHIWLACSGSTRIKKYMFTTPRVFYSTDRSRRIKRRCGIQRGASQKQY